MLNYTTIQVRAAHILAMQTAMAQEADDLVRGIDRDAIEGNHTDILIWRNLRAIATATARSLQSVEYEDDMLNGHITWITRRANHED